MRINGHVGKDKSSKQTKTNHLPLSTVSPSIDQLHFSRPWSIPLLLWISSSHYGYLGMVWIEHEMSIGFLGLYITCNFVSDIQ